MLNLLFNVLKWLYEAAITHAASEEGSAGLIAILDEAEADGIDVPFYQPSEPVSDAKAQVAQAAHQSSAYVPPQGKRTIPNVQTGGEG